MTLKREKRLVPISMTPVTLAATRAGRKTQTRRVINLRGDRISDLFSNDGKANGVWNFDTEKFHNRKVNCRYGAPGDILYVKESVYAYGKWHKNGTTATGRQKWIFKDSTLKSGREYKYADNAPEKILSALSEKVGWYLRPGIYMPRRAARIFLETVDIRSEPLQNITEADAVAEGIWEVTPKSGKTFYRASDEITAPTAVECYRQLWELINGARGFPWTDNPFVWVITYKQISDQGLKK